MQSQDMRATNRSSESDLQKCWRKSCRNVSRGPLIQVLCLNSMYLLTLSGTPIIFEGQEIGMINIPKSWDIEKEYKDVATQVSHMSLILIVRLYQPYLTEHLEGSGSRCESEQ